GPEPMGAIMAGGTYGWLTLTPPETPSATRRSWRTQELEPAPATRVGARLANRDGTHTVSAKIRTHGRMNAYTHIKVMRETDGRDRGWEAIRGAGAEVSADGGGSATRRSSRGPCGTSNAGRA